MQENKPFNIGHVFDQQRALESFASREHLLMVAHLAHRIWATSLETIHFALEKKELSTVATEAASLGKTLGHIMLTQVSAALDDLAREARAGRYFEAQQAEALVLIESEKQCGLSISFFRRPDAQANSFFSARLGRIFSSESEPTPYVTSPTSFRRR